MKFVTFLNNENQAEPGVLLDDLKTIVSLKTDFADVLAVIDAGKTGLEKARQAVERKENTVDLESVKLLAPLPNPRRLRDCSVFEEHIKGGAAWAEKMGITILAKVPDIWYQHPIYYKGNHLSIAGPDSVITYPKGSQRRDYELELGMVTGKKGKDIPKSEADNYIFGFVIFNDVSARDSAFPELMGLLGPAKGKDFDGGNIIGPWLVTKDEIPDIYNLNMQTRHNGQKMGTGGNTGDMYHKWETIIEYLSRDETLFAGEIVGSGTVGGGTLMEFGRGVEDGDVIEFEIDCLGILRNTVSVA